MSSPEYQRHPILARVGWVVIGAIVGLAVASCGVGAAAAVYRLVTA